MFYLCGWGQVNQVMDGGTQNPFPGPTHSPFPLVESPEEAGFSQEWCPVEEEEEEDESEDTQVSWPPFSGTTPSSWWLAFKV